MACVHRTCIHIYPPTPSGGRACESCFRNLPLKHIYIYIYNNCYLLPEATARRIAVRDVFYGSGIGKTSPGTRSSNPGTRNSESGTRNSEPGTGNSEPRTRKPDTRTSNLLLPKTGKSSRFHYQESGNQHFPSPGTGHL